MRWGWIALVLLALLLPGAPSRALPTSGACWAGQWWEQQPDGECRFAFYLRLGSTSGPVEGRFKWRLVRCPGLSHRIGHTGYERVAGRIDGTRVRLRGSSVSDPTLLATDAYNLVIDGDRLHGSTGTNERDWNGRIAARRVPCGRSAR